MPDWPCTRCGAVNLEGQRVCEGCGRERSGARPAPPAPATPKPGRPVQVTTWEQGQAAAKVLQAIVAREITPEEGRRRVSEILKMPELAQEES